MRVDLGLRSDGVNVGPMLIHQEEEDDQRSKPSNVQKTQNKNIPITSSYSCLLLVLSTWRFVSCVFLETFAHKPS